MCLLNAAGHRVVLVVATGGELGIPHEDAAGPDHLQVHRAAAMAASRAGTPTVYEATVDREYLHFVETHLVEQAILAGDLGMVRSHICVPSVMITNAVDVSSELDRKRAAMAAHASQIPETTSAFQLGLEQFAAVYGWEWFVRQGPPGP